MGTEHKRTRKEQQRDRGRKEDQAAKAQKLVEIRTAILRHGLDTHEANHLASEIDTIVWGS